MAEIEIEFPAKAAFADPIFLTQLKPPIHLQAEDVAASVSPFPFSSCERRILAEL